MSLSPIYNRLSHRSRADIRWLMVFALLIPGCVGKRLDLLSSRIDGDSSETTGAEPQQVQGQSQLTTDEQRLIAEDDGPGPLSRLTAFARRDDSEEKPKSDGGITRRIRGIWGGGAKTDEVTSDPFVRIGDGDQPQPVATDQRSPSNAASVDKLLASFSRKSSEPDPGETEQWWEEESEVSPFETKADPPHAVADHQFVDGFDSRLDQLRAQLTPVPVEKKQDGTLFAEPVKDAELFASREAPDSAAADESLFVEKSQPEMTISANPRKTESESIPVTFDKLNPPQTDLFSLPHSESRNVVADRIQAMLAEAKNAREQNDLVRAYRTAIEAQALAVVEGIEFGPGESHPQDLANELEAELRGSSAPLFGNDQLPEIASSSRQDLDTPFSSFGFPESNPAIENWDSSGNEPAIIPNGRRSNLSDISGGSGVNLFPPDDDFPSEAEKSNWDNVTNPFAEFHPGEAEPAADDIQLTIHEGSVQADTAEKTLSGQLPGFSERDNKELLSSVSQQRNRVFEMKKMEWPSLPSLKAETTASTSDRGPIRVAQAPRLTPELELSATASAAPTPNPEAPVQSGSVLGQVWRSQPIWLIAGLVLLVIALRLLPWPRENAG